MYSFTQEGKKTFLFFNLSNKDMRGVDCFPSGINYSNKNT